MFKKSSKTTQNKAGSTSQTKYSTKSKFLPTEKVNELIKAKAYEIYLSRSKGNQPGDATSDWVKAEKLVKKELGLSS